MLLILELNHLHISVKKIQVNRPCIHPKSTAAGKSACLNAAQHLQLLRLHQRYPTSARPFIPYPEAQTGFIPSSNKRIPWQTCMICCKHSIIYEVM